MNDVFTIKSFIWFERNDYKKKYNGTILNRISDTARTQTSDLYLTGLTGDHTIHGISGRYAKIESAPAAFFVSGQSLQ